MNKYQTSLDNLIKASCPKRTYCRICAQKAFCNCEAKGYIDTLQELVDKANPEIVKGISLTHEGRVGNCPACNKFVTESENKKYCDCGQKLNWNKGDD